MASIAAMVASAVRAVAAASGEPVGGPPRHCVLRAVAAASGEPVGGPPGHIASRHAEAPGRRGHVEGPLWPSRSCDIVRKPVSRASLGFTLPSVGARRPSAVPLMRRSSIAPTVPAKAGV
eukprot:9516894-Heterocapsa_arctica.AAC.1